MSDDSPTRANISGLDLIERYLKEIADLSQSEIGFAKFTVDLLEKTIPTLEAAGGAIWVCGVPPELHLQHQKHLELASPRIPVLENLDHTLFLQNVIQTKTPQIANGTDGAPATTSGACCWIACPLIFQTEVIGIFEIIQTDSIDIDTINGNVKLLVMACELVADYLRQQQLLEMQESAFQWQKYENLVAQVNSDLDLRHTGLQIVNECRFYLDCDRFTLLLPKRNRLEVYAISGCDSFDRRSQLLQTLETLSEVVLHAKKSLRFRGDFQFLPPQLESPLSDYVDQSHAISIDIIPLFSTTANRSDADADAEILGVLVIECFQGQLSSARELMIPRVAKLARISLRNSIDYNSLPFLIAARFTRRTISKLKPERKKLVLASGLGLSFVLAMLLIPATYEVRAQGELQPKIRRNIYAASEGEIRHVEISHNDKVQKGQLLLVLHSASLDLKHQKLTGEYLAIRKKLRSVQAERIQTKQREDPYELQSQRLSAEEEELQQRADSHLKELNLIKTERESLSIVSPIAGEVLTWNPEEILANRPVQTGQRLLTIADTGGPWILELRVPEHHIGSILAAKSRATQPLSINFQLATNRGATYQATVSRIAGRTEADKDEKPMVNIHASFRSPVTAGLRPDATVFAKIDCGTHSLGYVLFHDFYETIKTWILMR